MDLRGPCTPSYTVTGPYFVRSLTSEMHAYNVIMSKAVLPPTPPECGVTAGMVSARIMIDYTAAGSIYHHLFTLPGIPIHDNDYAYLHSTQRLDTNTSTRRLPLVEVSDC